MKKVLCISDSLGLPRPGVPYIHTWLSLVKEALPDIDFIPVFKRAATTDTLSCGGDYGDTLAFYPPDEVILQLGICDCSPRYMRTTSFTYRLMRKMPGDLQNVFWKIYKTFVKRSLDRTDVPLHRFRSNIESYLNKCLELGIQRVIIIKIAEPGPKMLESNPLTRQSVARYNAIYDEIGDKYPFVTVIHPLDKSDDSFYVDGYHANLKGNQLVAKYLQTLYHN